MNLDEIPGKKTTYIPDFIQVKTDEQHCRAELVRYYNGEALERKVITTLGYFRHFGLNIKEHDFCEENWTNENNLFEIRLVWKKRSSLQ